MNDVGVANRKRLANVVLFFGLVALSLGAVWLSRGLREGMPVPPQALSGDDGITATVLSEPGELPLFNLVDHNGQPFTRESLRGKWTFLFFGYTYCPDVCPMMFSTMNRVDQLLVENGVEKIPQYVFVSVDPLRDTPARLSEYVAFFNQKFIGLTGPEEQVAGLTKPLGIAYQRRQEAQPDSDNGYAVDHSAALLLINPDAELRALSTPPHNPEMIAADYQKIITQ